jgi:hypothetical protein
MVGAGAVPLAACAEDEDGVGGGARFRQSRRGAVARSLADKLGENVSIVDFGAESGSDVVTAMERAFGSFPPGKPGVLIVPPGDWPVGASVDWSQFKHVTLRIEAGAVFRHGKHEIILPAGVETGTTPHACFVGEGEVAVRDKDVVAHDHLPKGWIAYSNFAMGVGTLASNVSGTNNFAWGNNALRANVSGSANIAIGNDTLTRVKGGRIPAMGTQTGHGWNNVAIGDTALRDCTAGYENLAVGAFCLQQTTIGKWNVAIGHASQILATDGECNVSLGAYALVTNFGSNNLAIGWAALEAQVTGSNIAIGHMAMNANVTGSLNTAIGSEALMRLKSGNYNVSMGLGSLTNLTTGANNTGIGTYALSSAQGAATNNTAVGRDALLLLTTGNGNTALGAGALSTVRTFSNCTGIGTGASVTGSNQVQLGNSESVPHAFAVLQIRSDTRDKADIRDTRLGLDFIRALRPVDFRWNLREDYSSASQGAAPERGTMKRTRFHHGLLAQDVRAVIQRTGIDFGGYQDHAVNGGGDVLSLGYEELIAPLIKAVQQLSSQVEDLQRQIHKLTRI